MSDVLQVEIRNLRGKQNNRRLRAGGQLPAVLYGHGKESVSLAVPEDQFTASLAHGTQVVNLEGAASGQALLQDVQWDTFGQHVLHVDLLRVDASDRITVEVPLVLRGEAPGSREGGIVNLLIHAVEIETTPAAIPENLHININNLEINESITVGEIEDLPEGVKLLTDAAQTVAQCLPPVEEPEEEAEGAVEGAAEPEIIGQKDEDESEG